MTRRLALLVVALSLLAPSGAAALEPIAPPMELPGRGATVRDWLLGVRPGTPTPAGAERIAPSTLSVPRTAARAVAARLGKALIYAEPDRRVTRPASVPDSDLDAWARGAVVPSTIAPPPNPVPIAVVDSFVDPTHPDLAANTSYLNATETSTIDDAHGTQVASAAAALLQGSGVAGVLPGAPVASFGISYPASCGIVVEGIEASIRARVAIINLSLGGTEPCFAQYVAVQRAYGAGILVVAAAGNEFQDGNPVNYPAAFPHVLSVAAIDTDGSPASFSTANAAVDIAAPGVGVPLAVPVTLDDDGVADGYTLANGTSFAAPMVAGGAAWVRTARPDLSAGQLGDVLRFTARDLAAQGYDRDTGWGLMDIPAALAAPTPVNDPLEPNDDIAFVDGRVFGRADKVRWSGSGIARLSASSDQVEDPVDVYRFRLKPRSRSRISLSTSVGQAEVAVFDRTAKTVFARRGSVCSPSATGCVVNYRGRRKPFGYVAVRAGGDQSLNANYTLTFKRLR